MSGWALAQAAPADLVGEGRAAGGGPTPPARPGIRTLLRSSAVKRLGGGAHVVGDDRVCRAGRQGWWRSRVGRGDIEGDCSEGSAERRSPGPVVDLLVLVRPQVPVDRA